jgi:hypothetical protein
LEPNAFPALKNHLAAKSLHQRELPERRKRGCRYFG